MFISTCPKCQFYFTNLYVSPLTINPANASNVGINYQIGGAFRNEVDAYSFPSSKASVFFIKRVNFKNLPENDNLAVGFEAINEKSIYNGIKNNFLSTSFSYRKSLDDNGDHSLGIGFQSVISNKKIEPPSLIFEDQLLSWASQGFNQLSQSILQTISINYVDVNVGVNYRNKIGENSSLYLGTTFLHVNSPKKIFNGGTFTLNKSFIYQIEWEYYFLNKNKLLLGIARSTFGQKKVDLIANFFYSLKIPDKTSFIKLGAFYRENTLSGNYISPTIFLITHKFSINLLSEVLIGKKNSGRRGGFEIGLIYKGFNVKAK